MRGEDHQVRRYPGSGRWIETGDAEDGLHWFRGRKREKSGFFEKRPIFRWTHPIQGASNLFGSKSTTLVELSLIPPVILLYHKTPCSGKSRAAITSFRCLTWARYAKTITEGACE